MGISHFLFVLYAYFLFFFFFQAEDGIRDKLVTGVQTCALPIFSHLSNVCVPCPAGDFLDGTMSFLVGSGIGPFSLTPVLSAISLISVQMVLMSWGSVLDRRILALETIPGYLHCRPFSLRRVRTGPVRLKTLV